jgi:hypothetical protein
MAVGWRLLSALPPAELTRLSDEQIRANLGAADRAAIATP